MVQGGARGRRRAIVVDERLHNHGVCRYVARMLLQAVGYGDGRGRDEDFK